MRETPLLPIESLLSFGQLTQTNPYKMGEKNANPVCNKLFYIFFFIIITIIIIILQQCVHNFCMGIYRSSVIPCRKRGSGVVTCGCERPCLRRGSALIVGIRSIIWDISISILDQMGTVQSSWVKEYKVMFQFIVSFPFYSVSYCTCGFQFPTGTCNMWRVDTVNKVALSRQSCYLMGTVLCPSKPIEVPTSLYILKPGMQSFAPTTCT